MNSVEEIRSNGNEILVISLASHLKIPRFDFNRLRKLTKDITFVRDMENQWYLCGIGDHSHDVESTKNFFIDLCSGYDKIVFLGASMGGYGALLYGSLIDHDNVEIHAFSPQIDIDPNIAEQNPWTSNRVRESILPYIKECDKKYMKLHKVIDPPKNTYIYYGIQQQCDTYQASLIDCHKVEYNTNNHSTPAYLRDNGELTPLLQRILNP